MIVPYINPDTDGIVSSIAYAIYKKKVEKISCKPSYFGILNPETTFVLDNFRVNSRYSPIKVDRPSTKYNYILIDTHHKDQLPAQFPYGNVIEIIDHHLGGNYELFTKAYIQNEKVGAVATLIAEKYKIFDLIPPEPVAGILACGIVSNTLNFIAPSTSVRDKAAFKWLTKFVKINEGFIQKMFKKRTEMNYKDTVSLLSSDLKIFTFDNFRIGVSQLESVEINKLLNRADIEDALRNIKTKRRLNFIMFNGVDIAERKSYLYCLEKTMQHVLRNKLNIQFNGKIAVCERVILRKTDIIPVLMDYFGRKHFIHK